MIETVNDEPWQSPVEWMKAFRGGWFGEYPADLELVCTDGYVAYWYK